MCWPFAVSVSAWRAWCDQAVFVGVDDCLDAVPEAEFLQDPGHVGLGCRFADYQLAADLWVGQAADEQVEHLALTRGQVLHCARRSRRWEGMAGEFLDDGAGHGGREQRGSAGDDPDGAGDLFGRRGLEHEAAWGGPARVVDVAIEAERGQDQDPCRWLCPDDPPGCLDAIQHRHPDVHDHYVGPQPARGRDGVLPVAGLAHDGDRRLAVQDLAQSDPDQCLVVRDEDRGHVSGSRTRTAKPPPGREPASNLPPYRLTRSRIPTRPWPPPGTGARVPPPSLVISSPSVSGP